MTLENVQFCESFSLSYHPYERARFFRYADLTGSIPIVGAVSGIVRMISCLALSIFASKSATEIESKYYLSRSSDEFAHGLRELITLGFSHLLSKREFEKEEQQGKVRNYAHGKYMYLYKNGTSPVILYSNIKHTGHATFAARHKRKENMFIAASLQFHFISGNSH